MELVQGLLLNIGYGFLFFLAFGVMLLTMLFFGMALWDTVGRKLLRRAPTSESADSPR